MASMKELVIKGYNFLNEDLKDLRSDGLFLMSSPLQMTGIIIFYLYFVNSLGPRLMLNQKPFKLDKILIFYNAVQVILNAYILKEALRLAWGGDYNWLCQPIEKEINERTIAIARAVHLYFIMKLIDLLDTVFFILRKKTGQISFLHVYHHTGMVILAWCGVKWIPGGHDTFVGFCNCIVHVVMYSYYLFTVLKPEHKNQLWWKKHITQLQMVQFFLNVVHSAILIYQPSCLYPKFTVAVIVPQNTFMLCLFYDFYRKAYKNEKKI